MSSKATWKASRFPVQLVIRPQGVSLALTPSQLA